MDKAAFYHSKAWRRLACVYMLSQNYICERCGGPAEICHHKTRLNPANYSDPEISLNPARLEALCQTCHNQEHFGAGGATAAGYAFDENGEILPTGGEP